MEASTSVISTMRPKGLSAEQLILYERLLSFLDTQQAPRRVIMTLMKTTADMVQKSRRRMSSIFFKVEAARVLLDYWQDNSAAQSLKQQQILYSQRHGGEARTLAAIESRAKRSGLRLGSIELRKMVMDTYAGIKLLDTETTGWSKTVVRYVENQSSNPGGSSRREESVNQHGGAADTLPIQKTDEDFQYPIITTQAQHIIGSIRSKVLQGIEGSNYVTSRTGYTAGQVYFS